MTKYIFHLLLERCRTVIQCVILTDGCKILLHCTIQDFIVVSCEQNNPRKMMVANINPLRYENSAL